MTPDVLPAKLKLTCAQQIQAIEEAMDDEEWSAYLDSSYGGGFLVCWSLEVASQPAIIANMYSTQRNSMTISLTVNMLHKTTKTIALLDCGAMHNFINPHTIASLSMGVITIRS